MKKMLCVLFMFSAIMAEGKISGVSYFNYECDLTENATNDAGFSFTRTYLTYKNDISDELSFKFQSDINYKTSPVNLYLKKAQLDWKSPFGKITLGMQGMNMFNVIEKTWGFRFIEKSPMDLHKFSSSADMGVGYSGKFSDLNFSLLITNGSGYKNQEDDKHKKISAQAVYGEKKLVKKDGFNIGTSFSMESYDIDAVDASVENEWVYGLYNHDNDTNTDEVEGWHNDTITIDAVTGSSENNMVMSFFGGYAGNGLRIGGEFDMHTDSNGDKTKQIMAFYASYKAMDSLEALLYFDMYDPDTGISEDTETYIIAGINYYPTNGLIITPNIRMTSFEDGSDNETMFKMNFQFKF